MKFETEKLDNAFVFTPVVRRLDASVALRFKEAVAGVIQQGETALILDFSRVDFIDSSCLGALISLLKLLSGKGQLVICALNSNIKAMFSLTRMDRVFTLCADRSEALAALNGG
ncbi:STAS domain-containing protein [Pantoea piersonii]|jgi:anti-sigma B factor antagonist|uniref:STAS domain-containing protein n=1 Tax=Pantoea piersonii TaxID=2364647 RepID=A0AAJ5QN41_9GAMM|nr:STAS domain-containing protein [Pantoea piersonii]MDU6431642.1 STAS domain-containing protein [Pantoea sp.]MBZ6387936.1 STAS domain-containing protein [Pantoea piersonii]MBZ6398194.1 STAS domain-containing protein [Pantoea piersonii]MBZ6409604.1 STAS domain-containing protein [Pantoea piersonii]MBZ6426309.1 STAS domain-containing protein [Pantoea piersonii]